MKVGFLLSALLAAAAAQAVDPWPQNAKRVDEIAQCLPVRPKADGARIDERKQWARLSGTDEAKKAVAAAVRIAAADVPPVTDDAYLHYKRTGQRSREYSQAAKARRLNLGMLVVAECIENKGRFVSAISKYVEATLDEKSWVHPPHDLDLAVFDGRDVWVDLNASERALALAIALDWVGEKLPAGLVERAKSEIRRRVLDPYLGTARDLRSRYSRHWWFRAPLNWNSVCHSCVVRTALAVVDDRHERAEFCESAERGLSVALAGFGDDGFCFEGMEYWSYGWGHQLQLEVSLRRQTGGMLKLLDAWKARRVTDFGFAYQMNPGVTPNYADGGSGSVPAHCIALGKLLYPDLPFPFQETWLYDGDLSNVSLLAFDVRRGESTESLPPRTWFESAQVYIGRSQTEAGLQAFSFSVKGGNNGECVHQHHDIGSFNVALDDRLLAGDPGSMAYTAKNTGADRFKFPLQGSYGHPVPVVAGMWQEHGVQHAAKVVKTEFADDRDIVVYELSGAYGVPELESLRRAVVFYRKKRKVLVRDRVVFSKPSTYETACCSVAGVTDGGTKGVYLLGGRGRGAVRLSFSAAKGGAWHVADEVIPNPKRKNVRRIALAFDGPVSYAETDMLFEVVALSHEFETR